MKIKNLNKIKKNNIKIMETGDINTAKLTNTLNGIGFGAFNHWGTINREDILSSYSKEILETVWLIFTKYIIKNYESGKGTFIKNFGTFTFTNPDYNLEGTTNQFKRDLKVRRPVFIISNEFLDFLKPGIYTKAGGLIYYTQKLNHSINIIKINYSELSYGMNISKEEYYNILSNIIKEMGEQIFTKKFKNREMPNLGIFLIRGNVFGMKFYKEFNYAVMKIPQKLNFTKKNIELYMNTLNTNQQYGDLKNAEKAINEITPKEDIITNLTKEADFYLAKNYGIDGSDYDDNSRYDFNKVENYNKNDKWNSQNFFPIRNITKALKNIKIKKNLKNLMLPKEIVEAIIYNKGQIIKEMKSFDRRNNGLISRFEVERSFVNANIHPNLQINNIKDIIKIYAEGIELIDYYKLITLLIKEAKSILKNSSFSKYSADDFTSSFNNKFKLGPQKKEKRSFSFNNEDNNLENLDENYYLSNYNNLSVNVDEVENEIKSLKMIFDEIMYKKIPLVVNHDKFHDNNKILNFKDLSILLNLFKITYPKEKIFKILKFLKIEDPNSYTLNSMYQKLKDCKLTSYEMTNFEIEEALANLINIIEKNGGKNFLFNNNQFLLFHHFKKRLNGLTPYTENILTILFNKIADKKTNLTINDYEKVSHLKLNKDGLNEKFYNEAIKTIKEYINKKKITVNKYYDRLLSYNFIRPFNHLPRKDFLLAFQQEPFNYTEEQLNFIFDKMDLNKDNIVDRDEFKKSIIQEYNVLNQMQDLVKKKKLDIDTVAYRFEIDKNINQKISFYPFKNKMKKFDSSFSNEFIEGLFIELAGSLNDELETKVLLENLDVYKGGQFIKTNQDTFKSNFIKNIQNNVDFHTLKNTFEKYDNNFNGRISKNDFCHIINQFTKEFRDEDIMRLMRLLEVTDNQTFEVNYPEFLNVIYYNEKLDNFLLCIDHLKKVIQNNKMKNIQELINFINGSNELNYVTVEKLYKYFMTTFPIEIKENLKKTVICKFDLDSDGIISYEDLKGIINRYINTSFFKFENSEKGELVNLYAEEFLKDEEFKKIVKEIKANMKKKNITEVGLFYKLDEDKDGFITNYEFNKNISNYADLSPIYKDKIFNYLDYYHNGLVDLETFLFRFKEFKSYEILIRNNNQIEKVILEELSKWIIENKQLNASQIFGILDKDCDGLISIDDLKFFINDTLSISDIEFNEFKLERIMQNISLTKNKNIGLPDVIEFINRIKLNKSKNSFYINLTETLKETTNQNLFRGKENVDWINQIIERFGMYISEKFDNIETFYELFSDKESGKFKFENFEKFVNEDYECFEGFNLTKDELLAVYTSLDSQKKKFLNLDDFKNKLGIFDFYKKMQFDIKLFLQNNFNSSTDAFKYFLPSDINKIYSMSKSYTSSFSFSTQASNYYNRNYLTKREFYDGINNLFPYKYSTITILKYLKKYFNIDENDNSEKAKITFTQFSFIYYGKVTPTKNLFNKTITNDFRINKTNLSHSNSNVKNGYIYSDDPIGDHPKNHLDHPFEISFHPKLSTPFDYDPLEKLKRNILSTPVTNYLNIIKEKIQTHPNGICNVFEFRNLLKQLNLGLTNLEIEDIINKNGKTWNGLVNLYEFYKFITSPDKYLSKSNNNIKLAVSEFKQLLYKYYANPKLAFNFTDEKGTNIMDFDKFKSIIMELYKREGKVIPNFTILKNCYDYIDMKKDGLIDINEWNNAFGNISGKLDSINNISNLNSKRKNIINNLRKWETSSNVTNIYKAIAKNRKMIWDKVKVISGNNGLVQEDNFIKILKDVFPTYRLSNTQWKMIVEIGDVDQRSFINFENFIKLVEQCAKREGIPRF